ncbi:MAG: type II secretion system protein [Phycisphaerales bacterium]
MTGLRAHRGGFTMLEVMVAIGILVVLSAALITFTFGLAGRRDRLVREGERAAMLARVLDRVERIAATAPDHARHGDDWLELRGRGVWPAVGRAGVPAGPMDFTGRLAFSEDAGELTWTETNSRGESVELVVTDVQAVLVDHFDDLVTASDRQPPLRVCLWLAPVGVARAPADRESSEMPAPQPEMEMPGLDEALLPERPADVAFVVAGPMAGIGQSGPDEDDPMGATP